MGTYRALMGGGTVCLQGDMGTYRGLIGELKGAYRGYGGAVEAYRDIQSAFGGGYRVPIGPYRQIWGQRECLWGL